MASRWFGALTAALLATGIIAGVAPLKAEPFRDQLLAAADRLEARAAELEVLPGEQTRIGPGPLLKKGATGERVARLSQRLVELGLLTPDQRTDVYGDLIDAAVRGFQISETLRPDGKVGGGTLAALDRTPREAAAQMRRTAQSMRDFQAKAPSSVLLVNLPSQTVTLVRDGQVAMVMRAVVGRPSRETPLLEDRVTHVIVNPTWTVPPTVLKQDKLPLLRAKGTPGIQNATVYLDGEPVEPETVDWNTVSAGRVRIVQQPGDWNALGRFRFNLTNSLNIYLHGTNEPHLFDRDVRTISSGCVRLQDARALAEVLLAEVGVGRERIGQMLEKGEPQWVKVNPLPVQFVYWTATVEADGAIRVHPDVYDMVGEVAGMAPRSNT